MKGLFGFVNPGACNLPWTQQSKYLNVGSKAKPRVYYCLQALSIKFTQQNLCHSICRYTYACVQAFVCVYILTHFSFYDLLFFSLFQFIFMPWTGYSKFATICITHKRKCQRLHKVYIYKRSAASIKSCPSVYKFICIYAN